MRAIRYLLIAIAVLFSLLVIAIGTLVIFINPNDYKSLIEEQVAKNTEASLLIEGDIGWSFYPIFGFQVGKSVLTTKDDAKDNPFVSFESARIALAVLPLLEKRVVIQQVILDKLSVMAFTNKVGKNNWDALLAKSEIKEAKADEQAKNQDSANQDSTTEDATASHAQPKEIILQKLRLQNATVVWLNDATNKKIEIANIDLAVDDFKLDDWFFVRFSVDEIAYGKELSLAVDMTFDARLAPNIALRNLDMNTIAAIANFANTAQTNLSFLEIKSQDNRSIIGAQKLSIKTSYNNQDVLLQASEAEYDTMGSAFVNKLLVNTSGLVAKADMRATNLNKSHPVYSASVGINIKPRDLLLGFLGLDLSGFLPPHALQSVTAKLHARGDNSQIAVLNKSHIKIDDINITPSLSYAFANSAMAASLNLNIDEVDANKYLPPSSNQATPSSASNEKAATAGQQKLFYQSTEPLLPTALLNLIREQKIEVSIAIKKLLYKHETLANLYLDARIANKLLALNTKGRGFDGAFNADLRLSATQAQPIRLKLNASNVNAPKVLKLVGQDLPIKGLVSLNAHVRTKGNNIRALLAHLNGTTDFVVKRGLADGFDLSFESCRALTKVQKIASPSASDNRKHTPIKKLSSSFIIKNGVARNSDFIASIDDLRVTGAGNIDLRSMFIDYVASTQITGNNLSASCAADSRLRSLRFKTPCKGALFESEPASWCRFDYKDLLSQVARQATNELKEQAKQEAEKLIKQEVEKTTEKAKKQIENKIEVEKEKIKKQLGDSLKKLF